MKKLFLAFFLLSLATSPVIADNSLPQIEENKTIATAEVEPAENFDYKQLSEEFLKIEESIKSNEFTKQSLDDAQSFLNEKEIVLDIAIKNIEKNAKFTQDALTAIFDNSRIF